MASPGRSEEDGQEYSEATLQASRVPGALGCSPPGESHAGGYSLSPVRGLLKIELHRLARRWRRRDGTAGFTGLGQLAEMEFDPPVQGAPIGCAVRSDGIFSSTSNSD